MVTKDWSKWHDGYDQPGSSLQRRLQRVQFRARQALDAQPAGPIRILSMCAGQGRDLLELLPEHPRRDDVRALLVEGDPQNVEFAVRMATAARLDEVRIDVGDASLTTAYAAIVPVDIALVCGVFGNVPDEDVRNTIDQLPRLLRPGATVIWTRTRKEPDLTPAIRGWFADDGFEEVGFDTEPGFLYGVGTQVFTGTPRDYEPGVTLFRFEGDGASAAH